MLRSLTLLFVFTLSVAQANEGGGYESTAASLDIQSKNDFFYLSLSQTTSSSNGQACLLNRQIGLLSGAIKVPNQKRPRFLNLYRLGELIEDNKLMIHRNDLIGSLSDPEVEWVAVGSTCGSNAGDISSRQFLIRLRNMSWGDTFSTKTVFFLPR